MSSCCGHKYKQQKLRNSNKKTYLAPSLSSSATTMTTGIGRWWLGPAGLPLTQFPHSSCCCYRHCGPCPRLLVVVLWLARCHSSSSPPLLARKECYVALLM